MTESFRLIDGSALRLADLPVLTRKPPLFEPGEPRFWDDPHIARGMLAAHLDPTTPAASRAPEVIEASVEWLTAALDLQAGDALLDLGCGPGLYARRFAARGLCVTGVDLSANSLDYARRHDPASTYLCGDYRALDTITEAESFDAAVLIYGDFCVLNDADRDRVLSHVWRALKPGGRFVFDVTTPAAHPYTDGESAWYAQAGPGFWKPGPHLVLEQRFLYPEHATALDQYTVIEADGRVTVYRNWFHDYTPETIVPVLKAAGFAVCAVSGDLAGALFTPGQPWLGVLAQKVG